MWSGLAAVNDGHAGAHNGVAANGFLDCAPADLGDAHDEGSVALESLSLAEGGCQLVMRGVVFRDDDEPTGLFIEAMNNAGAVRGTDTAELAAAVVEQRVD